MHRVGLAARRLRIEPNFGLTVVICWGCAEGSEVAAIFPLCRRISLSASESLLVSRVARDRRRAHVGPSIFRLAREDGGSGVRGAYVVALKG